MRQGDRKKEELLQNPGSKKFPFPDPGKSIDKNQGTVVECISLAARERKDLS
jgi:hypothetical protein